MGDPESFRAVILRDDENKADMLERAFKTATLAGPAKWDVLVVRKSDPDEALEEFIEAVDQQENWMQFDVLLLDVHWGKRFPMEGFEIYQKLKRKYDSEVTRGLRPRLPWRVPPIISTFYAGSADSDPALQDVLGKARDFGIPRDHVMQMVIFDDAERIVDASLAAARKDWTKPR